MNVFQLSRRFKAALLQREKAAARVMLGQYHDAYAGIAAELQRVTDEMEEFAAAQIRALDAGRIDAVKRLPVSWLFQQRRLEALLEQTRSQMRRFGAIAGAGVRLQKYEAALQAEQDARELARAALGEAGAQVSAAWNTLATGALESLAGTFGPESPVTRLFDSFGPEAAAGVRSALVRGVAMGQGPRQIAGAVRDALGEPLTRALTISRTETMRAYREASIASYAANSETVLKWRWTATKTGRTCAMCLAMDGEEFELDAPFGSHPNCRCVPTPITKTWAELGIEGVEEPAPLEDGTTWFARQPEATQLQVLGPAKYARFAAGDISLADLVAFRDDPEWGPTRWEKSARALTPTNA